MAGSNVTWRLLTEGYGWFNISGIALYEINEAQLTNTEDVNTLLCKVRELRNGRVNSSALEGTVRRLNELIVSVELNHSYGSTYDRKVITSHIHTSHERKTSWTRARRGAWP